MTLTIHTEQDEQRQLLMTIEVPEERVEKQMRNTARKLARDFNIPGFRRGRAPYNVILKRVGRDNLRAEAVEEILQPVFEEALEEVEPDIYAPAQFDDMDLEPLVLKFTIPLVPEVQLGDYRALRKEIEPVTLSEEAVAEALENIQTRHQKLEEVDRAVEAGDMVTISGKGELIIVEADEDEDEDQAAEEEGSEIEAVEETENEQDDEVDDTVLFDTERLELLMDSEKLFPGTDFVANLIGMSLGDNKSFDITFPEDFEDEDMAGKEATFDIEILQVQSRDLPALDDALAEEEGHESLEALKEKTEENLLTAAKSQAKNDLIEGMIDDMLEDTTMVFPPAAVDQEIDNRIESFKSQVTRSGWEWDDYLKLQATTEDDMRGDFREAAEEAVHHQLVLRQFVLDEKLTVTEEDIDAKIDEQLSAFGDNEMLANSMRDYYKQGAGFDMLSSEVLMDKVAERMEAILSGNAPDLEALEAEETEDEAEDTAVDEATDADEAEPEAEAETDSEDSEATNDEVESEAEAETDSEDSDTTNDETDSEESSQE